MIDIKRNLDVLLVAPSWANTNNKASYFSKKAAIVPPLGICGLASLAETNGFTAGIIDGQATDLSFDALVDAVTHANPHLVGITSTSPFFMNAITFAQAVKEKSPDIKIAIGGVHVTIAREAAMESCFDFGFVGDGELSFPAFLSWMKTTRNENVDYISKSALTPPSFPKDIKGLLYRHDDAIIFTGMPDELENLDELPFPAFHLLDMERYTIGTPNGRVKLASILTTRGCPFHCIFCAPVAGYNVRHNSAQYALDYIGKCIHSFDIHHFYFFDDTLTLNRKHIEDICIGILERGYNITFEGSTRANLVDSELLTLMHKAGLVRISFGLETVEESIRKTIKKEVPLCSYIKANKIANALGIETLNSCMIGLPGESIDSIRRTLSFLRFFKKEIQQANISIATPYPGTELVQMALKGERGLTLVNQDLNDLRRYGSSVMRVGDLAPKQLIQLQNDAIVSIHMATARWPVVVRKFGWKGLFLTFKRFFAAFPRLITNKNGLFFFNKDDYAPWKKMVKELNPGVSPEVRQ